MGKIKWYPTLIKIISAFLTITLLPIVTILIFFYPQNHKILNQQIQKNLVDYSQTASNVINTELEKIYQTGMDLKNSLLYRPISENNSYLYYQDLQQLLRSCINRSSLIEQILLYHPENPVIYSATGTVRQSFFLKDLYYIDGESQTGKKSFLPMLTETASIHHVDSLSYNIYANSSGGSYLIVSYPLNKEYGWALFLIPQTRLSNALVPISHESYNFLLYDQDEIFLSQSTNITEEEMWELVNKQDSYSYGDEYVTFRYEELYFNLEFQTFEKGSILYGQLNRLWVTTVGIIICIILVGTFSMLYIIRANYSPLIAILRWIGGGQNVSPRPYKSEFDMIQDGIRQIQSTNQKLNSTLQSYRENSKALFLYEFLSQNIQNINDLANVEDRLEIDLYQRIFFPVFIEYRSLLPSTGENEDTMSVVEYLNQNFRIKNKNQRIQVVFSACVEKNLIFCLASMDSSLDAENILYKKLNEFLRSKVLSYSCIQELGPYVVLVGKPNRDIYETSENVQLLYQTLNSYLVNNLKDGSIWEIQNLLPSSLAEDVAPFRFVYDLIHAVDDRDCTEIYGLIEKIVQILQSVHTSIAVSKTLFEQVLYIFSMVLNEKTPLHNSLEMYSTNEMSEILKDQAAEVAAFFEQENQNLKKHQRNIVEYVDEHFLDANFSITVVADHYNMQISNLSSYFKKFYKVTFQQYVTQKKMEYAKQILAQTTMTLDEVSDLLGYANASSFGRSFKHIIGMTPGEYRAQLI